MAAPKRIVLLNFPTEIGSNWGCTASCAGFRQVLKKCYPAVCLREHAIHFRVPERSIPRNPDEMDSYIRYLAEEAWEEYPDLKWADLVILDGEGSIHEFTDARRNDFVYLKLVNIYAAKALYGARTMIVNHTIDFRSDQFAAVVKKVYPTCDYISVREPISQRALAKLGVCAHLTSDTAFLVQPSPTGLDGLRRRFSIPEDFYVFFLSQLTTVDPLYLKVLCKAICDHTGRPVCFFVLSDNEKRVVATLAGSDIPHVVIDEFVEPGDIVDALAHAEFCLSERFHATIFSVVAQTPFMGFRSNTYKIAGLIEMLGHPVPELVLGETPISEVLSRITFLRDNHSTIKANLARQLPRAVELARTQNIVKVKELGISRIAGTVGRAIRFLGDMCGRFSHRSR